MAVPFKEKRQTNHRPKKFFGIADPFIGRFVLVIQAERRTSGMDSGGTERFSVPHDGMKTSVQNPVHFRAPKNAIKFADSKHGSISMVCTVGVRSFRKAENVMHQDIVYAKGNPIQVAEAVIRSATGPKPVIRSGAYVVFE